MARYTEKAVDALRDHLATNLAANLRTVETEAGLGAGALADPVATLRARAPFDNRSPLVQVYDESARPDDQRNDLWDVDCTVIFTFLGGADLEANEIKGRRYTDAIVRTILADTTLGGEAVQALITDVDSVADDGDSAASRMIYGFGVSITVHCPGA